MKKRHIDAKAMENALVRTAKEIHRRTPDVLAM